MKIFIAGATGAIGRPLVSALVFAGHKVIGMTSSPLGVARLAEKGAESMVVNAADAEAVKAALLKARPDVVIDELTSLPKHYTPEAMKAAAPRDRALRLEGGRFLQEAAKAAGVRRYIVQSTGFFYAPGEGLAKEAEPLARDGSPAVAASVDTYTKVEKRVLEDKAIEGVALRYGFFYGPDTWYAPDGDIARQLREQKYPIVGKGEGVWSYVHIDDAAVATVAAIDAAPGVYNVVDDDPAKSADWLRALARVADAPEPKTISEEEALRTAGPDFVYYSTKLRGASNAKAKRELRFVPRRLEWFSKV